MGFDSPQQDMASGFLAGTRNTPEYILAFVSENANSPLVIRRLIKGSDCVIGELTLGGVRLCYTLEDPIRLDENLPKIKGKTAIPAGGPFAVKWGNYKSMAGVNHGQCLKFEDAKGNSTVPQFAGIWIHSGASPAHTSGCVLLDSVITYSGSLPRLRGGSSSLKIVHNLSSALKAEWKAMEVLVENYIGGAFTADAEKINKLHSLIVTHV